MVDIIAYQESWPVEFGKIALALREGLGAHALRIDHIGSTAIPGLSAKDVIDIQLTVTALDEELMEPFNSLGYSHVPSITKDHRPAGDSLPQIEWEKWFFRSPSYQRATNTHVRVAGRANQRYALLFRDYLRTHQASAAAYGELKQRLAQELRDSSRYSEVKDAAVDLVYLAANEWANATGWQLRPSDA